MRAEQMTDVVTTHGEGPVGLPGGGTLLLDMLAGDVLELERSGEIVRRHVDDLVACVRPTADGGFVVATADSILLLDSRWEPRDRVRVLDDPSVRFNEGACDLFGGFVVGTMAWDQAPGAGVLLRYTADGRIERLADGIGVSNGIAFFSADDGRYVDSATGRVDSVALTPSGRLARAEWAQTPAEGVPDGLCLDAEGGTWVAMFGGGAVLRFDAGGRLDAVVHVPVQQVTACTFSHESSTLLISTSRHGLADPERGAGALFAVDAGVTGSRVHVFA